LEVEAAAVEGRLSHHLAGAQVLAAELVLVWVLEAEAKLQAVSAQELEVQEVEAEAVLV
jgi:hypothetical protein